MKSELDNKSVPAIKRVVLIKTNLIDRDSRVLKERDALKNAGYSIKRLCWDRGGHSTKPLGKVENDAEKRLTLRAPWGAKILPFLPIWWLFVFFNLLIEKWDVAQAINFDSAIPTIIAGKIKRKPIIYEMEDSCVDQVNLPRWIRYVLIQIKRFFMRLADAVIIVDETQIEEVGGIPNSRIIPVYDSAPDVFGKIEATPSDKGAFTLLYDGNLTKERRLKLENVWEAIKEIEDTMLIITGSGNLVPEIEEWCMETPEKVAFLGWVSNEEILKRSLCADLLLALRSPLLLADRYNCGSKVLKAMMCGKPSLVVKGTSSADKVAEANCGLLVDIDSIQDIREAIIRLKQDPELCRELGANARKAYEHKYNWDIMEQRLIDLYRELFSKIEKANQT